MNTFQEGGLRIHEDPDRFAVNHVWKNRSWPDMLFKLGHLCSRKQNCLIKDKEEGSLS